MHPLGFLLLLVALFLMSLIRYLFTGSTRKKHEDEPYVYKIVSNIILVFFLIVTFFGVFLHTFEFYEFSLKWFIIITLIIFNAILISLDLMYMKHTKEYLIKICTAVATIPLFYLAFSLYLY